jgi:hypothetical protein
MSLNRLHANLTVRTTLTKGLKSFLCRYEAYLSFHFSTQDKSRVSAPPNLSMRYQQFPGS